MDDVSETHDSSVDEIEIVPNSRITILEEFYEQVVTKGELTSTIVSLDLDTKTLNTPDLQGVWATDQITRTAKALNILPFILPRVDPLAVDVPVIPPVERYIAAHKAAIQTYIKRIEDRLPERKDYLVRIRVRLNNANACVKSIEKEMSDLHDKQPDVNAQPKEIAEYEAEDKRLQLEYDLACRNCDEVFKEFDKQSQILDNDTAKVEDKTAAAVSAAETQHKADRLALSRVKAACDVCFKFVAQMITKVPSLDLVVRASVIGSSDVGDPFAEGDLCGVYTNLLRKYRTNDQLELAYTIMDKMTKKQGDYGGSLERFFQMLEEFVSTMRKAKIVSVTIEDLAAMIALNGFEEKTRKEFLSIQTTLSLSQELESEYGNGGPFGDNRSVISTNTGKLNKALFPAVQLFVHKIAKIRNLNGKYENSSKKKGGGRPDGGSTTQQLSSVLQEVFATIDSQGGDSSSNSGGKKHKGKGRGGASDELVQRVFAAVVAAVGNKVSRPAAVCYKYLSGTCSKGDDCPFKHPMSCANISKGEAVCNNSLKGHCSNSSCNLWHPSVSQLALINGQRGVSGHSQGGSKGSSQSQKDSHQDTGKSQRSAGSGTGAKKSSDVSAQLLYACNRDDVDWVSEHLDHDDGEDVNMVVVPADPAMQSSKSVNVVMAARENGGAITLGWDSYASINVTNKLQYLNDAQPVAIPREAYGVGGSSSITHMGRSDLFGGIEMAYLEGGYTPNLLSLGRVLQDTSGGVQRGALFTGSGAIRFKITPEVRTVLDSTINLVVNKGLLEGQAQLRNNVYEEIIKPPAGMTMCKDKYTSANGETTCAVTTVNLFDNRVKFSNVEECISMFAASGFSENAIVSAIETQSVKGLPPRITKEAVTTYFQQHGKDVAALESEIINAPLRRPQDYQPEEATVAGHTVQLDNCDPSFSRMTLTVQSESDTPAESTAVVVPKATKKPVPSCIGGYKDSVIAVDGATGFVHLEGRISKRDPHHIVRSVLARWKSRWPGALKLVRVDKEFVTPETITLIREAGARIRQSVPGDHRRNTGMVEGCIRWVQELAQGNMNRLDEHVRSGFLTKHQSRSLWFAALMHAVMSFNLRPSLLTPGKTRFEEGTGVVASLSDIVMLPFGMELVGRKLVYDEHGRGVRCIYVGPSLYIPGGINVYDPVTGRCSAKYAFKPVNRVPHLTAHRMNAIARALYGSIEEVPSEPVPSSRAVVTDLIEGVPVVATDGSPVSSTPATAVGAGIDFSLQPVSEAPQPPVVDSPGFGTTAGPHSAESGGDVLLGRGVKKKDGKGVKFVVSDYETRSRRQKVMVVFAAAEDEEVKVPATLSERPPKPIVPSQRKCASDQRWISADIREAKKLTDADTFLELPRDELGRYIKPADAIYLRLLRVREFKWKADPDTGQMCWLECARFVCDGSVDKRPTKYYAETPDRTLLLLMTSIGATIGETDRGSDVERAYLNALSIDRNIVIIAPPDMHGVPRVSLLNKGLYGSRGGALSWQLFIDARMQELQYRKLDVCRGVYMKDTESGEPIRALRHSDDFRMSCVNGGQLKQAEGELRDKVRMAPFTEVKRFLGCTFERINAQTGLPDPLGTIVLVRQRDKILEMQVKFQSLHEIYNAKNRVRRNPVPVSAMCLTEDLERGFERLLDKEEIEKYQSIVGCISWMSGSSRPDTKFGYFLLSTRLANPRAWDIYMAVWVMDFLVATIDTPLVLGGSIVDPEVYADASFATLPERRSVVGHCVNTGRGSGVIYANVGTTKSAVMSVWEAELVAGSAAVQTALYISRATEELQYPVPHGRTVRVDNQAQIDWIKGSVSNKRSRHIDTKFYFTRHMHEAGEVNVEYVQTEENIADILTKPLAPPQFRRLAGMLLGHLLVRGLPIKGLFSECWE